MSIKLGQGGSRRRRSSSFSFLFIIWWVISFSFWHFKEIVFRKSAGKIFNSKTTDPKLFKLYNDRLKPKLIEVQKMRRKAQWLIPSFLILIVTSIVYYKPNLIFSHSPFFFLAPYAKIILIFIFITFFFLYCYSVIKYYAFAAKYKEIIVKEIVSFLDPTWKYDHAKRVDEKHIKSSGLIKNNYSWIQGDDLIIGKIDKTEFESSEITTNSSESFFRPMGKTLFKCFFFHADFNKEFNGNTFIRPESDGFIKKIGDFIGGSKKSIIENNTIKVMNLVKLENPEFESFFQVYSTDQIEARYILTPKIMESLVKIKKQFKNDIYFSFSGTRIYMALKSDQNLFEPRFYGSIISFNDIEIMYNLFYLNKLFIKELNLNTRIWTKK